MHRGAGALAQARWLAADADAEVELFEAEVYDRVDTLGAGRFDTRCRRSKPVRNASA
jgi:hypothetical protein